MSACRTVLTQAVYRVLNSLRQNELNRVFSNCRYLVTMLFVEEVGRLRPFHHVIV